MSKTQPHSGRSVRHRHVRILQPSGSSKAAKISLVAALVAGFALVAFWRMSEIDEPIASYRVSSLVDRELTWQCTHNNSMHTFRAAGLTGARPCPICGADAYPIATFVCDTHGEMTLAFKFVKDENGVERVSHRRATGGDWEVALGAPRCSLCQETLRRKKDDPFERLRDEKTKNRRPQRRQP